MGTDHRGSLGGRRTDGGGAGQEGSMAEWQALCQKFLLEMWLRAY